MIFEQIAEFTYSDDYLGINPDALVNDPELHRLREAERLEHMQEEYNELLTSLDLVDELEVVDALGDLAYICVGTLLEFKGGPNQARHYYSQFGDLYGQVKVPQSYVGLQLVIAPLISSQLSDNAPLTEKAVKLMHIAFKGISLMGYNPAAVINLIHQANLKRVPGESRRGHSKDVVKPAGWEPPKLELAKVEEKEIDVIEDRRELYGVFHHRGHFVDKVVELMKPHQGYQIMDGACRHALHMALEKIGRMIVSPYPHYQDNWTDIKGYASLAIETINELKLDQDK